jgi:hypothetical protein
MPYLYIFYLPWAIFTFFGFLGLKGHPKKDVINFFGACTFLIISTVFISVAQLLYTASKENCPDSYCLNMYLKYGYLILFALFNFWLAFKGGSLMRNLRRASSELKIKKLKRN